MKKIFIKPDLDLYFNAMPLIGQWIKIDYYKAKKREELFDLVHKWFNEADTSHNTDRAKWYNIAAKALYSVLTGKSYESILGGL